MLLGLGLDGLQSREVEDGFSARAGLLDSDQRPSAGNADSISRDYGPTTTQGLAKLSRALSLERCGVAFGDASGLRKPSFIL